MKTLTIIPGSFSPPHHGHWDMISHYAAISDYVIVIIASPNKALRPFQINGVSIYPDVSKAILDMFIARSGLTNVKTCVSGEPSPVRKTAKIINTLKDCEITIGVSSKGSDAVKYDWILDYVNARPDIIIHPPSETAFTPVEDISATNIRSGKTAYEDALPDFIDYGDIAAIVRGK